MARKNGWLSRGCLCLRLPVKLVKVTPLQRQQRLIRVAGQLQQAADGRFPFQPLLQAQGAQCLVKVVAKVLYQGGHQAEVAPAVEGIDPRRGHIELDGPGGALAIDQGLLQQPDVAAKGAALPLTLGKQVGKGGGIAVLAEDVEIAAWPVEPDGQGAHQRHIQTQALQLTPQGRVVQQGMGRALARIALGQIVEAAPVRAGGQARRWKNCGRGRSQFISQKAEISLQGSPW